MVRWHASFVLMMAAGFPSYKNGMKIMHRSGVFSRLRPNSSASLILTSPLSVSFSFRSRLLNSATGETLSDLKKKTVCVLFALWEMTQDETTDEAHIYLSDHIYLYSLCFCFFMLSHFWRDRQLFRFSRCVCLSLSHTLPHTQSGEVERGGSWVVHCF